VSNPGKQETETIMKLTISVPPGAEAGEKKRKRRSDVLRDRSGGASPEEKTLQALSHRRPKEEKEKRKEGILF